MRKKSTCKSHTAKKKSKGICCQIKKVRTLASEGGYIGPAINSEYGGKKLNNSSYAKYYKGMLD